MPKYTVRVHTSDIENAGTDSDIFITLKGNLHTSQEMQLDNADDNFERNKWDVFELEIQDLGTLESIRLRSDNSGSYPGWHCEKVIIQKTGGNEVTFPCNNWIADNILDRTLTPVG